ncbi:uncharacterized protein E0L32_009688 [Thyridium curvatum]|uniref:Leucine rich repeat domain containing protein n=1 Tax=Thyridium curvatum TaxID=1093900 RepID=A0A507AX60_9PEZI|nr:uncharacterized protein E0L32_009688 [Thyridium curvatum]TPX08870.1 hypothetical protein E0L32_009688 [Thyridium curvatum]
MMMADLPSYQEAVSRIDWLPIVAPYIPLRDYARLCRVSRRFREQFAARLWNDPLRAVRSLGLHPESDLDWYYHFIYKHVKLVRRETLALVRSLDFRGFAKGVGFFDDHPERNLPESCRLFPGLFPNLRCILLDGHPECDPGFLTKPRDAKALDGLERHSPLLLSLANGNQQLPLSFFESRYATQVVYLDVSYLPGSLKSSLLQGSFNPRCLPNLKILKARGREMDDATATILFSTVKHRLWSLDLSENPLTDAIASHMLSESFCGTSLQRDAHFEIEGKLGVPVRAGSSSHGPFVFIHESRYSAGHCHPDRYLVDAPAYFQHAETLPEDLSGLRSDGAGRARPDTVEDVKMILSGGAGQLSPDIEDVIHGEICRGHGGITHLRLNGTAMTAAGAELLLRNSLGHLEHFECDSMELSGIDLPIHWSYQYRKVYGLLGAAHLLRPVVSSNLRGLRIHHSLVTLSPTLELDWRITRTDMWLAETHLQKAAALMYPEAFVPDMNPRLRSLTLTRLPRFSSGPVIERIVDFLKLAAAQEAAIKEARVSSSRRSPHLLDGLRHIRLEFEPSPFEDADQTLDQDGASKLLKSTDEEFSFFADETWDLSSTSQAPQVPRKASNAASSVLGDTSSDETPRNHPYTRTGSEYVEHVGRWNNEEFSVPVWVGNGASGPHEAVNIYMRNVCDPSLRRDVIPATPCHVRAGAPAGTYLFSAAWHAGLQLSDGRLPTDADLKGMRDVVEAIKEHRARTRLSHERRSAPDYKGQESEPHWAGRLEVVLQDSAAHRHSSKYWR